MKHIYESPRRAAIIFTPRFDGTCRKPLIIERCVCVKTGKEIKVHYLAKDDKVHHHTYHPFMILKLIVENETVFEESTQMYEKRIKKQIEKKLQGKRMFGKRNNY